MKQDNTQNVICIQNAYETFFNALCELGVEKLIQAASELYQCPVLLTDENYKLLYQYPQQKIGISIWDSLYENRTLPSDIVWEYQKAFLLDINKIYDPFYADWGLAEECPRIFGEVYTKEEHILGHFAIFFKERPCQKNDIEVAKILAQALQIKMSNKETYHTSNSRYLQDILSQDIPPRLKSHAVLNLSKRLKGNFCLMVSPIGNSAAQKAYVATAINQLSKSFRNTVSTIFDNNIVTLFGEMRGKRHVDIERKFLESASNNLIQTGFICGVSSCFSNFMDIRSYYEQAYYTALYQKSGLNFYDDMAPDPLFVLLLNSTSVITFLHPALLEMFRYDGENGTQYFATLKAYSLSMHDKDSTAASLCIHRNTLLYRLNRIRELFHLPFEEPRTALHLLNSFQIWDMNAQMKEKNRK